MTSQDNDLLPRLNTTRYRGDWEFRVQKTVPWPMHRMQRPCTAPHLFVIAVLWDRSFWQEETVLFIKQKRARHTHGHCILFLSQSETFQERSGGLWRAFKRQCLFLLLQWFSGVSPCTFQLDPPAKFCKNQQFSTEVSEQMNTVTLSFLFISGMAIKQRMKFNYWKISHFVVWIRTGSSFL